MHLKTIFKSYLNIYLAVIGILDIVFGVYPLYTPVLFIIGILTLISGILISLVPRYPIRPLYLSCIITNIGIYLYATYITIQLFSPLIPIIHLVINLIIIISLLLFLVYNLF